MIDGKKKKKEKKTFPHILLCISVDQVHYLNIHQNFEQKQ